MFASENHDIEKQLSIPLIDHCHEKVIETDENNTTTIDLELANEDIVNTVNDDDPEKGLKFILCGALTSVGALEIYALVNVGVWEARPDMIFILNVYCIFYVYCIFLAFFTWRWCSLPLDLAKEACYALTCVVVAHIVVEVEIYTLVKMGNIPNILNFLNFLAWVFPTILIMHRFQVFYPQRFWYFLAFFYLAVVPVALKLGKGDMLIFSVTNYTVVERIGVAFAGALHRIAEHPFLRARAKAKTDDDNENDNDEEKVERKRTANHRHNHQTPQ